MSTPYAEPVLAWYARNARDLPWRAPGATPWSVLVSEFMLQQTPVARVLPEYLAWMARWPTPAALAAEPAGEAIRQWGGSAIPARAPAARDGDHPDRAARREGAGRPGRPARAAGDRQLHRRGRGQLRLRPAARRARHQRAAGAGQAGRRPAACPAAAPSVAERRLAESLLPAEPAVAARWSVAVMELGALVCTAASPRCGACPVARDCAWLAAGRPGAQAGLQGPAGGRAPDSVRRHRPAMPGPPARGAARLRRPGAPGRLDAVWAGQAQLARALDGLVADGLVDPLPDGRFALPGGRALPGSALTGAGGLKPTA